MKFEDVKDGDYVTVTVTGKVGFKSATVFDIDGILFSPEDDLSIELARRPLPTKKNAVIRFPASGRVATMKNHFWYTPGLYSNIDPHEWGSFDILYDGDDE